MKFFQISLFFLSMLCVGQYIVAVDHISVHELKGYMDRESGPVVINVLNKHTFKDCNIKGSINVSVDKLEKYAEKKLKSKKWSNDTHIVVYCASYECPLSGHAFKVLEKLGFTNVQKFEGGMREWKQAGYPVIGDCKGSYLKG